MTTVDAPTRYRIDADALAVLMRRRNLNPSKLALAACIDRNVIYRYLNGARVYALDSTARAIGEALSVDVNLFADPASRYMDDMGIRSTAIPVQQRRGA